MELTAMELAAKPDLRDLAARANAEHHAYETTQSAALTHAVAAGEALIEAKALVGHGGWLPWLRENFDASERSAQQYMRIARNPQRVADLETVREAIAELSDRDPERENQTARREWARRALSMRWGCPERDEREVDLAYKRMLADNPRWAGDRAVVKLRDAIEAVQTLPPDADLKRGLRQLSQNGLYPGDWVVPETVEGVALGLEQLAAYLHLRARGLSGESPA